VIGLLFRIEQDVAYSCIALRFA